MRSPVRWKPGKSADLLVLDKNPLDDIKNISTSSMNIILKEGETVSALRGGGGTFSFHLKNLINFSDPLSFFSSHTLYISDVAKSRIS